MPSSVFDKLRIVRYFIQARFDTFSRYQKLRRKQQLRIDNFLRRYVAQVDYYRNDYGKSLAQYPLMDKSTMMANFARLNSAQVELSSVQPLALLAEACRDFSPEWRGFTVGLSSGTSGQRGVFLVSKNERLRWAGILLAKTLTPAFIIQIVQFWRPSLSIAFFLRANSNLYNTLQSARINFNFFDLLQSFDQQIGVLNQLQPQVLVAPASILQALAKAQKNGSLRIAPQKIINVAEVLDATTQSFIASVFKQTVHQLYQATEGFLAYSCERGNLHLNESYVHIEKAWIDTEKTRFHPVVTDFTRRTQIILRYRLNDILKIADQPCGCGNPETHIEAIEGRADEVFWLPLKKSKKLQPIYPDSLRRYLLLVDPPLLEYSIVQQGFIWRVALKTSTAKTDAINRIEQTIGELCDNFTLEAPLLIFSDWQPAPAGQKCRRLICEYKPECIF